MSEQYPQNSAVIPIGDDAVLRALLESHGFDTNLWGEGATKTVEALWLEVDEGETEILQIEGELTRRTNVAAVDVEVELSDGRRFRLYEEKQIYRGGATRERSLMTSLAEKIKPGEGIIVAARRAVEEELGISGQISITPGGEQVLEKSSQTFNGMRTQLLLKHAIVKISEDDFKPTGYIEVTSDKSVYFKWVPLEGEVVDDEADKK